MLHQFETDEYVVSYEETEEVKNLVFHCLVSFFREHEFFNGESLFQSDEGQIESPNVLAELLDKVFKFKITYKDELN